MLHVVSLSAPITSRCANGNDVSVLVAIDTDRGGRSVSTLVSSPESHAALTVGFEPVSTQGQVTFALKT